MQAGMERRIPLRSGGCAVLILVAAATGACSNTSEAGQGQVSASRTDEREWVGYEGAGFSLEHPDGWEVMAESGTGKVDVAGDGARASIHPFYIPAHLPPESAAGVLEKLAAQSEAGAVWAEPIAEGNAVSMTGTSGDDVLVASLVWVAEAGGTAGTMYFAAAPAAEYDAIQPALARIFASFAIQGTPAESTEVTTERWTDPVEGAFSVEIPSGWHAEGGTSRPCPTLVQGLVEVTSPDGEIYLAGGDAFPFFTEPIPAFGLPEGSTYPHPCGYSSPVATYAPGNDFAIRYLLPQIAPGFRVVRNQPNPAVADRLASYGLNSYDAGELEYSFRKRGVAHRGIVWTITERIAAGGGANWHVWRLFLAHGPRARYEEALNAGIHLVKSLKINPRWARMQAELTADQSAIIADMGEDISHTISEGYWGRQAVLDEIDLRRSNAILEVDDYEDPVTGESFKLNSSAEYYWINPQGNIVGTNTDAIPDVDFRRLLEPASA
jgi:hypothetical protein